MKHILILSGLMAATALAQESSPGRCPYIARQPLTTANVASPSFTAPFPALSPAFSEPGLRDAFVKMTTAEDGLATLHNRIRLLGTAIEAVREANKRTHQLGVIVEKYARALGRISTWSSEVFVTRKPMVVLK